MSMTKTKGLRTSAALVTSSGDEEFARKKSISLNLTLRDEAFWKVPYENDSLKSTKNSGTVRQLRRILAESSAP